MKIFLLRHPETDWNGEWRFQGRTDIPVSKKGKESLERLCQFYANYPSTLSTPALYKEPELLLK